MKAFLATLLVTIATAAPAADHEIPLVQPSGSTLHALRIDRFHGLRADFGGSGSVTGTLVAEWSPESMNVDGADPDYTLELDAASEKRVPHFDDYPVHALALRNGRHALFMALGESAANAFLDRKRGRAEVVGTYVITDYSVSIECDAAWAEASVVSARKTDPRVAAVLGPVESC